jgi:hypothetical protein
VDCKRGNSSLSSSASTRRGYASDWVIFPGWCVPRGWTPLPATPAAVAAFLAAEAEAGAKASTINRRCPLRPQALRRHRAAHQPRAGPRHTARHSPAPSAPEPRSRRRRSPARCRQTGRYRLTLFRRSPRPLAKKSRCS